MSIKKLPRFVCPGKMARKGCQIEGTFPVSGLKRVDGLLTDKMGEITVSLNFKRCDEGFVLVDGRLETQVFMQCQRCMENTLIPVSSKIALACVESDSQRIPFETHEPLVVTNDKVDLDELVEEELLLALPVVAYHTDKTCEVLTQNHGDQMVGDSVENSHQTVEIKPVEEQNLSKDNPFALLAHLKTYS